MISVGKRTGGFTIIEVMIVLASTGALLLIAMTVIGGQIASTNFQTGTRAFATELQNIANQVTSGQYSYNNFSCSLIGGSTYIYPANTNTQGQNLGCEFIGKNIYIPGSGSNSIKIYSVTGPRSNTISNNDAVINIAESIDSYSLNDQSIKIKCIYYESATSCNSSTECGVGLLSTDNSLNNGAGFDLYAMQGSSALNCAIPDSSNKTFRDSYFGPTLPYPKNILSYILFTAQGSSRLLGITIRSNSNNTSQSDNIQGSGYSVSVEGRASC